MKNNCKITCLLILPLLLLFAVSCNKTTSTEPADLIDKEKMTNIMVDMNILEGAMRVNQPKTVQDSMNLNQYYQGIFKKFKVSKKQFDKSLDYYTKNPDKFAEIYDEVITRLSKMQSEESVKK